MRLPGRDKRFGVGKRIGGSIYVHREYAAQISDPTVARAISVVSGLAPDFRWTVVKSSQTARKVSLIACDDFDAADEPTVGDSWVVRESGAARLVKSPKDPWIYHHKWMFVADDYTGFDVEASKRRSAEWMSLDGIDYARIGKKSFWEASVLPRLRRGGEGCAK